MVSEADKEYVFCFIYLARSRCCFFGVLMGILESDFA